MSSLTISRRSGEPGEPKVEDQDVDDDDDDAITSSTCHSPLSSSVSQEEEDITLGKIVEIGGGILRKKMTKVRGDPPPIYSLQRRFHVFIAIVHWPEI